MRSLESGVQGERLSLLRLEEIQDEHVRKFQILKKERERKRTGEVMGSSCGNEAWTRPEDKHSCSSEAVGEVVGPLSADVFKSRLSKPPLAKI